MEFFDFLPDLSRSNEAYFGREAPLAKTILTYAEKLNNYINNKSNFKDPKFFVNLTRITTEFGNALAKDLNAEKVTVTVNPDKSYNAWLQINYIDACDVIGMDEYGRTKYAINFDKIAELENISIGSNGYQFVNSKNKILFISLNLGLFTREVPIEQISGIICHEIGHCFQDGIFGLYKDVADMVLSNIVEEKRTWFNRSIFGGQGTRTFMTIKAILGYILFPFNLSRNPIFTSVASFMEKLYWKVVHKDPQYLMKDKLKQWDSDDKKESDNIKKELSGIGDENRSISLINYIVNRNSQQYNKKTRSEAIEEQNKQLAEDWEKELEKMKKDENVMTPTRKTFGGRIIAYFRSVVTEFFLIDNNIANTLALSNYNANQYAKISFYKRYEFFADVFAASYGFGADLYKNLNAMDVKGNKQDEEFLAVGLNKIPMFKSLVLTQKAIYLYNTYRHEMHGSMKERNVNMYTALVEELKTNPALTPSQKKSITDQIKAIEEADEAFYNEQKQDGFWFKYYNKLIDNRVKGKTSKVTIKEVLEPIKQIISGK